MNLIKKICDWMAVILLVILAVVAFLQVSFRFVFNLPLDWTEEITRYVLIMLVYICTMNCVRDNGLIRIEIIDIFVKGKAKDFLDIFVSLVCGVFMFLMTYLTIPLVQNAISGHQTSPALQIPMALMYTLECIMFLLISLTFIYRIIVAIMDLKKEAKK